MNDTQWFANKAKMINHVLISNLDAKAKVLVLELVMRRNPQTGRLDPGVARLCKARGIKDTKNFKGLDTYLPGLVTVQRTPGKKNEYTLNDEAIMALPEAEVKLTGNNYSNPPADEGYSSTVPTTLNHPALEANPPSVEGYYPPSVEGYYPPSVEGANSKVESKEESKLYNKEGVTPVGNQGSPLVKTNEEDDLSSGQDYKEVLVSSGKEVEEIAVLPLVETKSPGYSSVTKKEEISTSSGRGVNEDDLEKKRACSPGYRKNASFVKKTPTKPLEVVDASLSASGANEAPKVQEIPEKPQKPVQDVPQRSQYDTDSSYEKKVWNAQIRQGEAVRKWKQDLVLWESTYGANASYAKPEETYVVTDEFKAQMTAQAQERMRFRAQGY